MLLQSRPKPPVLRSMLDNVAGEETTLFVQNAAIGLPGVKPGTVKYLRVLEQVPRGWNVLQQAAPNDGGCGSPIAVINRNTHIWVAVLHGIVPVQEDGSAYFIAPANRNIFLQALDEHFMQIQTMRTFINLRQGERRSCIGCHEDRRQAPATVAGRTLALQKPPVRLMAQPGDKTPARPVHYTSDVQPVLDRNCVRCHSGKKPKAKLNLTGELTTFFSRSYEELLNRGCVKGINEWKAPPSDSAPLPPYARGASASKLIQMLRKGHNDVKLELADFVKLVTWVDLNLPYYGTYFGRRNLIFKDHPNFRPVPTLHSAEGNNE